MITAIKERTLSLSKKFCEYFFLGSTEALAAIKIRFLVVLGRVHGFVIRNVEYQMLLLPLGSKSESCYSCY
jgi:hypothetical protein